MANNNFNYEIKKKLTNLESHVVDIAELMHQNLPKRKYTIIDVLAIMIAFLSFTVACYSVHSSKTLTINNSSLNFTYEKIDIITPTNYVPFHTAPGDKNAQGTMNIYINTKVISGQIASLYLIQKQNDKFVFTLLNEKIQNKFSKIKEYNAEIFLDLEEKGQYKNGPIGEGLLYILSEDIYGKIDIDVIQIIGSITKKYTLEESGAIEAKIYQPTMDYSFRYLKGNKLVTLDRVYSSPDDINNNWIDLPNTYLNDRENLGKINIKRVEKDIAAIKEKYSKY